MNWYKFDPVDTLLFKGAEPMMLGENHTASALFPPPAQTITGALRTAILNQHGIAIDDYYLGKADNKILEIIGPADGLPGFSVIGPLFEENGVVYLPAPYNWFIEKEDETSKKAVVYKSHPIDTALVTHQGDTLYWTRGRKGELISIGGNWLSIDDFNSDNDEKAIKNAADFFVSEARTGIALSDRNVRAGHLYVFHHTRLKPGVSLVFAADRELPLADEGLLTLGAEKRFGKYGKMQGVKFSTDPSNTYMTLSVVPGSTEANDSILATGKIQYIGGWDMKKGFHKPMRGYYPAGSIFNKKINTNVIAIQEEIPC